MEARFEHFVIAAKCKQDSKVLTYPSYAGTKIHGYGLYWIHHNFNVDYLQEAKLIFYNVLVKNFVWKEIVYLIVNKNDHECACLSILVQMAEYQFVLLQNDFILQRKPHSPQREFKMKFFFFFFPFLSQIHTEARFMNQVSSLANTRKTAENAFIHPLNPVQVCHLSLHQCDQMINKKIPKFLLKLPEYLCLKSHLFKIAQKSTNLGYFWKKCCHQELKKSPNLIPLLAIDFLLKAKTNFYC